jgi:hypothetical protein
MPIITGVNQLAIDAAEAPANPSRERTPAAVQLGTAAATPISAPRKVAVLLFVRSALFIASMPIWNY